MTEAEWLAATDPRPLIGAHRQDFTHRKARLFAVACCRLVSPLFSSPVVAQGLDVAERYAEGVATEDERAAAFAVVDRLDGRAERARDAAWWADISAANALMGLFPRDARYKGAALVSGSVLTALPSSRPTQLALFRCVVGNPFRPVTPDPRWLTSPVLSLAGSIYDARDFAPMPVLADALEEAGCENQDVLNHCRGPGPHVRGCWVVDLILGKG